VVGCVAGFVLDGIGKGVGLWVVVGFVWCLWFGLYGMGGVGLCGAVLLGRGVCWVVVLGMCCWDGSCDRREVVER